MSFPGDVFSFPNTPINNDDQDSDFEFDSVTPSSPSSDPFDTSPADYLFLNGRLLPHVFPPQQPRIFTVNNSPPASQASSASRNGSLASSRSSSCSSGRTNSISMYETKSTHRSQKGGASALVYGSSRRWQFMVTVGRRESWKRKKVEVAEKEESRRKRKEATKKKMKRKKRLRFGWRLFQWLLLCKECHAIDPSTKSEDLQKPNT